jgi:hypothetical protein
MASAEITTLAILVVGVALGVWVGTTVGAVHAVTAPATAHTTAPIRVTPAMTPADRFPCLPMSQASDGTGNRVDRLTESAGGEPGDGLRLAP